MLETPRRPYLQRRGERRHTMQTEATRRTPRPGNALRPGPVFVTAIIISISITALLPGADARADQENNPQGQGGRGKHGCPGARLWNQRDAVGSNQMEGQFNLNYIAMGGALGSRRAPVRVRMDGCWKASLAIIWCF